MMVLLNWLANISMSAALVLLMILCLRKPLRHWLGAEYAYCLWLLVPLHLLGSVLMPEAIGITPMELAVPAITAHATTVAAPADASINTWLLAAGTLWVAGAAYYFVRIGFVQKGPASIEWRARQQAFASSDR
jgi:beta-lactamase regulating signal transducer with metallopeptidase domain